MDTKTEKSGRRKPTITVEGSYGEVTIEVRTSGDFYLDSVLQAQIPRGGKARLAELETGSHDFEMRYENSKNEIKRIVVEKEKTIHVVFTYVERSPAPEGFVLVEPGSFIMGSESGEAGEKPIRKVSLSRSFYMSEKEITQRQWSDLMNENPSSFKGADLPVHNVSWDEAIQFCNRLSKKEGLVPCYKVSDNKTSCDFSANGYRLPTEAEWEFAARGGWYSLGFRYPGSTGGDKLSDLGWYRSNADGRVHEVGRKSPNELGLYGMAGNIWEWRWDFCGDYDPSSLKDPKGLEAGRWRVRRGGSWDSDSLCLRSTVRNFGSPEIGYNNNTGIRLIRSAD